MEKKNKENLIQDTTNSEKVGKGFGVEIPSDEARKITDELSKINDLINHDEVINVEDLENLSSVAKQTKIDVGGEIMTVEEAEKIPDLKENMKIWEEIKNGNLTNYPALTYVTKQIAELLSEYKGDLFLNNIIMLSDSVAESLVKHKGYISLNGLATLSDSVAECLSKYKGRLDLSRITTLSDSAMKSLSKYEGFLLSVPYEIRTKIDKFKK